jgi:hypothetical protein
MLVPAVMLASPVFWLSSVTLLAALLRMLREAEPAPMPAPGSAAQSPALSRA